MGGMTGLLNTLTVEFKRGGIGQWTWAGGIAINAAEEHERYVLTEGTISDAGGDWHCTNARWCDTALNTGFTATDTTGVVVLRNPGCYTSAALNLGGRSSGTWRQFVLVLRLGNLCQGPLKERDRFGNNRLLPCNGIKKCGHA